MSARKGTAYTVGFAGAVCVVCSILVSVSAVSLRDRQERNQLLDRKKNVLLAAGLLGEDEQPTPDAIEARYEEHVHARVIERATGRPVDGVDPAEFDQQLAAQDPARSEAAPANRASVQRLPDRLLVYEVGPGETVEMYVLPVHGKGLWSTMYGYLALDDDTTTVRGIAFYQHGETPGLGGEIENPKWRASWPGRRVFDESWAPVIEVIKGAAGPVGEAPHQVDGLSGATLTANGVTHLVRFWAGEHGYGPFLSRVRGEEGGGS